MIAETAGVAAAGAEAAAVALLPLLLLLLHLPRMYKDTHAHVPMQTAGMPASCDTTLHYTQHHYECSPGGFASLHI
jgi:hypothetical protein